MVTPHKNMTISGKFLILQFTAIVLVLRACEFRSAGKSYNHVLFINPSCRFSCFFFSGKKFYFRGCGWKDSVSTKKWSEVHKRWIDMMDELFTYFMNKDFLTYEYSEHLCCLVADDDHPSLEYDDATWENVVKQKMMEREWIENETSRG